MSAGPEPRNRNMAADQCDKPERVAQDAALLSESWQRSCEGSSYGSCLGSGLPRRRLADCRGRHPPADEGRLPLRRPEAADLTGQAYTHQQLGYLWGRRDRPDRALDHAQQALTLYRAAGHRRGQAWSLNAVGWCHVLLGDPTHALAYCQQALTLFQQLGDRWGRPPRETVSATPTTTSTTTPKNPMVPGGTTRRWVKLFGGVARCRRFGLVRWCLNCPPPFSVTM